VWCDATKRESLCDSDGVRVVGQRGVMTYVAVCISGAMCDYIYMCLHLCSSICFFVHL